MTLRHLVGGAAVANGLVETHAPKNPYCVPVGGAPVSSEQRASVKRVYDTLAHTLSTQYSGAGYSRYVSRPSTIDKFSTNARAGGHKRQLQ